MIRLANINDLKSIVDIYNQTIQLKNVTADTTAITVESKVEWFNQFNDDRPIWVFEKDHKVIAWLSVRSFYGRPAYQHTVEVGLYIDENNRQKGLGSEMLLHALNECKRIGIKTILAFIFGNNQVSLHFFSKYGFIEYGKLPSVAEIEDEKIDLIIMGLKL
jgi:phosphinothricin acetyltransferase